MDIKPVEPSHGKAKKEIPVEELHYERWRNYKAEIKSTDLTALFNRLQGRMLTMLEAFVTDKDQLRALKQITKERLWDDYALMQRWVYEYMRSKSGKEGQTVYFPFGGEGEGMPSPL